MHVFLCGSISSGGTEKFMFGFDFLKPKPNMNFSVPPISCHKMKTHFFWLQEMAVEMNTVVCFCFACTAHQTRKKSGVRVSITCEEMKSWI